MIQNKPRRSLRTILILWFLIFSIVPMAIVAIYSFLQFQKAIDKELSQRLKANMREINGSITEKLDSLDINMNQIKNYFSTQKKMSSKEIEKLSKYNKNILKKNGLSRVSFFDSSGTMILLSYKDKFGLIKDYAPVGDTIKLLEKTIVTLKNTAQLSRLDKVGSQSLSFTITTKLVNRANKIVGYFERVFDLNNEFLNSIKTRLNLEMLFLNPSGELALASQNDFYLFKKDFFQSYLPQKGEALFDMKLKSVPYRFLISKNSWEKNDYFIAIGAAKSEIESVLKNLNLAFISIFVILILLLIVTLLVTTSWVLRPLYDLVDAIQSYEASQGVVNIPVRNETEVGLLTASFNEMSRKIFQARTELQKKVAELEKSNKELQDTQVRLVHSAKMVSLGQLVAGVAHELNNPIGFINSNMGHLREYANKLLELLERAEKSPQDIPKLKKEYDVDFIAQDMPKLISSCEEGARRTKDIVVGLRNFSRLEGAKLEFVDIPNSIETTLDLLKGEIKGRIEIVKNYDQVPKIKCHGSEINQVFMNLLSNAIHAIEGPGKIWISLKFIQKSKEIGWVQISIQDSGKGIPQDQLEKIYDPFFTTKAVGQGTGLGLSISYGIIQSHGGEISVKSEVGVGTEFTLLIPEVPLGESHHHESKK